MKKLLSLFGALMIASLILSSCNDGGSIESDAKKLANLQCKAQKLGEKLTSGDMSVMEEITKLETEAESLAKELEKKYSSADEQEKFIKAVYSEMNNCK